MKTWGKYEEAVKVAERLSRNGDYQQAQVYATLALAHATAATAGGGTVR